MPDGTSMDPYLKDPGALLDYTRDWTAWLSAGETISTSQWIVPAGLTLENQTNTTTKATVWLSGGTVRTLYQITNRITTNQGRTDDRSIWIYVTEQ